MSPSEDGVLTLGAVLLAEEDNSQNFKGVRRTWPADLASIKAMMYLRTHHQTVFVETTLLLVGTSVSYLGALDL